MCALLSIAASIYGKVFKSLPAHKPLHDPGHINL